jgi:hypothetical protein
MKAEKCLIFYIKSYFWEQLTRFKLLRATQKLNTSFFALVSFKCHRFRAIITLLKHLKVKNVCTELNYKTPCITYLHLLTVIQKRIQ